MGMRWRVPGMKVLGFGRDSSEVGERSDIDMDMENSPAPSRTSPVVGVLMGSGRESYGDPALDRNFPRTCLRPECSYSCSLCLLLAEANVPFEMYKTDLGGKASWHAQVNPKMETPSLRLANQEEWIHGTDKIVDMLASDVREVAALSTCTPLGCPAEGAAAREHLDPQMCSFALFMALAGPSKMRDFLLSKHGLDPKEEDVRGVVLALRKRQRQVLGRWEEALASGDYLCGSRPGLLDARLVSKLFTSYQLIDSGLASLGCSFEQAAPRSFAYLCRFSLRRSWRLVFGEGREVRPGKLDAVTIRTVCGKFSKLCPELLDGKILPALARARGGSDIDMDRGALGLSAASALSVSSHLEGKAVLCLGDSRAQEEEPTADGAAGSRRGPGGWRHEAGRRDRIRLLVRRAGGGALRPVSKASRMLRFNPATLYFLILEKEWWFCGLLAVAVYGLPVVLLSLLAIPLNFDNDTEEAEIFYNGGPPPHIILAFRFTAGNVISMGFGTVFPTSDWGYLLATLSQLLGILINVFVFAAVLAKFQSPKADVVFSQSCCIFTRDGTPHLCLRLGNLRCHTLFNPHIRLFLLRDHETAEGESFVRIQEIKVDLPGTVSGVYSVTHKIDEDSPLREAARVMASGGAIQEELLAIQCTFTALDPVYQAEVCAKYNYSAKDIGYGKRFADMITLLGERPFLDFCKFEELVDAGGGTVPADPAGGLAARSASTASIASSLRSLGSKRAQTTLCL